MRLFARGVAFLGASYLCVLTYFIVIQRDLVFLPGPPGSRTPADFGAPFESVRIAVKGGGETHAWYLHHPEVDPDRIALHYSHGNGGSLSSLAHVAQLFYSFGWDVLLYDYRGYGTSSPVPGGFREETVVEDGVATIRWLQARSPGQPLLVWGHSLGAAVASHVGTAEGADGMVLECPFTSLYAMARVRYPLLLVPPFVVFDRFDNTRYVQTRAMPLLVAHAENDEIIPLAEGRAVFERAKEPKSFLLLHGIGHNEFPDVVERYRGDLLRFAEEVVRYHHHRERGTAAGVQ